MNSDTYNDNEIGRDAFDDLMDQSEPVMPVEDNNGSILETTKAEPTFEAAPISDTLMPPPPIPHLRSRLQVFKRELNDLRKELVELDAKTRDIPSASRKALAAIAAGQRIPADDADDPTLRKWLEHATNERLLSYRSMALEEIDVQSRIIDKGLVSLETLDAFDKPTLPGWSNLPPAKLARTINAHAHLIFQTAIVR